VRRLFLVLAMMGVAVLVSSGAALGITNGTPDTNRYPYVGALVDRFDDETYPYCTGTLISPTVLLTAAHCYPETSEEEDFGVTFDQKYTESSKLYRGTFIDDPNGNDIAVVVFDNPPLGTAITLPKLPTYHQFDDSVKGSKFTIAGYGGELEPKGPGGPIIKYQDQRQWAVTTLNQVTRTYLRTSQNKGSGGTCYGDSGGPNFVGTSPYPNNVPTIASITITGDAWCHTTNVTLRLDIDATRLFLESLEDEGVLPVGTVPPKPQ
jgi:Trypsin